jgi:hypothetical protein
MVNLQPQALNISIRLSMLSFTPLQQRYAVPPDWKLYKPGYGEQLSGSTDQYLAFVHRL